MGVVDLLRHAEFPARVFMTTGIRSGIDDLKCVKLYNFVVAAFVMGDE